MTPHAKTGAMLFALLACNTVYYILAGRFSEALESVAWYALLILFVLEIARPRWATVPWTRATLRAGRALAALAIAASAVLYVREREWLDVANLLLWISVVALLEIELRLPAVVATHHKIFLMSAAALYAALGCLVIVWLTIGKWMNAWDAALWLAAFGLLEVNILLSVEKIFNKNR